MRLLIGIPCHNEGGSIEKVLAELRSCGVPHDTLVVDDGSKDDTARRARPLSKVAVLSINLGIGGAVQTAIRYAHRHDYDLFVQLDGDGQHPPDQVRVLLDQYLRAPASILVGSRFCDVQSFRSTRLRRIGITVISSALRALYGIEVRDPTSGFRLFDRKAIAFFHDAYPQDFPEPISIGVAHRAGLTYREVAVTMRERQAGASSIYGFKNLKYMVRVLGYLALYRMRASA